MCGIVAILSQSPVLEQLLHGLSCLEYRGYDSAGLGLLDEGKLIEYHKVGKVKGLIDHMQQHPSNATIGLAHTRWATHGPATEKNAHPQSSHNTISIVHNGIIENASTLKTELIDRGYIFTSDTDTEVLAHLIHYHKQQGLETADAIRKATDLCDGSYAIVVMDQSTSHTLYAACRQSPLVIGHQKDWIGIASDPLALIQETQTFIYLQCGELATCQLGNIHITDAMGQKVTPTNHQLDLYHDRQDKQQFRHHMQKEMFEQPSVFEHILMQYPFLCKDIQRPNACHILGCGSSYHAGMLAKYWLEECARIPTNVYIASEYRYQTPIVPKETILLSLSQSGETADTIAAIKHGLAHGYETSITLCNAPHSTIARLSAHCIPLSAGVEVGVASTKAYLAQMLHFFKLTQYWSGKTDLELENNLSKMPSIIKSILEDRGLHILAQHLAQYKHLLVIGRGLLYPTALEGALKLKEITYIHAEALPGGELKHGPLALIDPKMPTLALVANDHLRVKMKSNLEEIKARGGEIYVLHDLDAFSDFLGFTLPEVHPMLTPFTFTVALQCLAYHIAVLKGLDVDQPRNLAKSVTVE
jgi:glucosamine--fructose-6-phosphate aminotransferase (isomerizing)